MWENINSLFEQPIFQSIGALIAIVTFIATVIKNYFLKPKITIFPDSEFNIFRCHDCDHWHLQFNVAFCASRFSSPIAFRLYSTKIKCLSRQDHDVVLNENDHHVDSEMVMCRIPIIFNESGSQKFQCTYLIDDKSLGRLVESTYSISIVYQGVLGKVKQRKYMSEKSFFRLNKNDLSVLGAKVPLLGNYPISLSDRLENC